MQEIKKKCFAKVLCLIVLMVSMGSFFPDNCHGKFRHKKILLLNSYGFHMQWTRSISLVMADLFNDRSHVDLFVEFMDTKRYSDPSHYKDLLELYKRKYGHMKFDLVITSDDNALSFALDNRGELFSGVPIVFCGVNNTDIAKREDFTNITGVFEVPGFKETIDLALQLFPSTRNVFIINESNTSGMADRLDIENILESYSTAFKATWVEDKSENEIREIFRSMTPDSIILLLSYFGDKENRFFSIPEGAKFISEASKVPVFSMWEYFIGHGIIGGQVTSGKSQGENAAEIAMDILKGKPVKEIPIVSTTANSYMFDYNQLKRFDVDETCLPKGSVLINRSLSIWELYRTEIILVILIITILILLVLFLFISNRIQKNSEQKLQESEERFRLSMEATMDGLWDWNVETGNVYYSHGYLSMLGYTKDEFKNHITDWRNLIHKDDRNKAFKANDDCIENRRDKFEIEFRMRTKDGHWCWILSRSSAITRDDRGRATRIIGTHTNITQRKRTDESLRLSHKRFLTVLDSVESSIYVSDMNNYEVLFMNKKMIEAYGGDMTGEICWSSFHNRETPCPSCTNDKLINHGDVDRDAYVWQGKNPTTGKWYINHDRAIEWIDGRKVKLQIATDITELKQMEKKLRQSQKIEAIGVLAGGIAHDFNNILAAILGYTELATIYYEKGGKDLAYLTKIQAACERAKALVQQILAFSRQDETRNIHVKPLIIVKQALTILRPTIPVTIDINADLEADSGFILADPTRIHQIVMNLCTNAFHAMEKTGGKIDISLKETTLGPDDIKNESGVRIGKFIKISVCDSGPGLDSTVKERMFDPYFTTKATGKGTGMGLAIVHGIVSGYGGMLMVDSELGKGTSLHVFLPVVETESAPKAPEMNQVIRCGKEKILFIDDEKNLTEMSKELLPNFGYSVKIEHNSEKALEIFKNNPWEFDMVVTDQTMPGMTGTELAVEMMKIREDIPIILCTGYSSIISEKKAKKLGIKEFVLKPIPINDLTALIRRVLDDT